MESNAPATPREISPQPKSLGQSLLLNSGVGVDQTSQCSDLPTAVFIFRRDLRIQDNTSLLCCAENYAIYPIFILCPEQVNRNFYKSSHCIQYMLCALQELKAQIVAQEGTLHVFYGDVIDVLGAVCDALHPKAVFFNRDYSPYAVERDEGIAAFCASRKIACETFHDMSLQKKFLEHKADGEPLLNFEDYYNYALSQEVDSPDAPVHYRWAEPPGSVKYLITDFLMFCQENRFFRFKQNLACKCDRADFFAHFRQNAKNLISGQLSCLLRFGVISPREVYKIYQELNMTNSAICKNLFFRDFMYYVACYYPRLFQGDPLPADVANRRDDWDYNDELFDLWQEGRTGFPLIDATMRKLRACGFMEHKLRFFVALFLVRELNLDWRDGEKYFSTTLIDIDWILNLFNWIGVGGATIESSKLKQGFNFWRTQREFDPQCKFIKEWVPELENVSPEDIHDWRARANRHGTLGYPPPVVPDYDAEKVLLHSKEFELEKKIKQFVLN